MLSKGPNVAYDQTMTAQERDENTDIALSALKKLGIDWLVIDWLVSSPTMKQKKLDALDGMLSSLESRQMYEDCAFVKSVIDRVRATGIEARNREDGAADNLPGIGISVHLH